MNRPLELWGGVECTVNRIEDCFLDQLQRSGHWSRLSDLDLFAELGLRKLRFPVLWECLAPDSLDRIDWSRSDERMEKLRDLGIEPIVGLLHHGSGPRYTSLVDADFSQKLADFARRVALRYPWVNAYTPVNEPLTTARFSGLYGLWHPHAREELTFARAFLAQCRAVVVAMRAILEVNPAAQLVQTEDLGKTFSTPKLSYQADFENERRWITWDLLLGKVDHQHPLWGYFRWAGVTERELIVFLEEPCVVNVIGVNHYITSERFLDEECERYPSKQHGGNGRDRYVDVDAVRARPEGVAGPKQLLRETVERYHLPVAVTEAHLCCTREEQLRWFAEIWDAACALREENLPVVAVTAWSLLGAYDWNSLLTDSAGHYEAGAFDLRSSPPRRTALAAMLHEIATSGQARHPLLQANGWWRRSVRFLPQPLVQEAERQKVRTVFTPPSTNSSADVLPVILIAGATGTLGRAFARICFLRGLPYRLLDRSEMDIADHHSVEAAIRAFRPWAIINAAGFVRVDEAQTQRARCFRENSLGAATLAAACARREIALLTFSSDLVFDGRKRTPYLESDRPSPLNVYGKSKTEAEKQVAALLPQALIVRSSTFFGPWDQHNFVTQTLQKFYAGEKMMLANDVFVSPTYVPDLVHAALDLLIDRESGFWHLANAGAVSWAELARQVARAFGGDETLIRGCAQADLPTAAPRPQYSVLGSERGQLLSHYECALDRYMRDRESVVAAELSPAEQQLVRG